MRRCSLLTGVCASILVLGSRASVSTGQVPAGAGATAPDSQTGPAPAAGAVPKGTLGPQYVDASFGFGFRPLAGATIDRRKRTVEGRLQLAQFVRLDVAWSLAVRLSSSQRPIDVEAAREALEFDLSVQYPDWRVTLAETVQVGPREGVRLAAAFSGEGQIWLRQQLVVPLRPKEYVLLILTTPHDDLDVAGRTFSEILESFQIVRTETQQKQIEAALERGADLLQRAGHGEKKITDRILEPVTLRLTREGQPVGMVEIHEKVDKIAGKEGVRNLQQAWIFNPDGSVQFLQEEKFISADFTYDEWRNLTQLMPSKQTDPKQRVIMHMEAGIRRGDQLIVKYAGQNPNDRQDKAIEIDRSYGSTGLPLLLPRLVDLDSPELYAFSMYDTERRGMSLRTLRVAGPAQVTVAGRRVSGYKIEDCEGLLPPVNEIIVDRSGRPVHLASGAVEMTLVSPEQLEAEFGERIRATQKQFRESMGLPEPSAQPQAGPAGKSRAPETKTRSPGRTRGRSRTR